MSLFRDNELHRKVDYLTHLVKELRQTMSVFSDDLKAFQDEMAKLLANIDAEIKQLADAVAAGSTDAADIQAGIEAITAATQAAKDANDKLTADDPPAPPAP